jgi:hypothetical protein
VLVPKRRRCENGTEMNQSSLNYAFLSHPARILPHPVGANRFGHPGTEVVEALSGYRRVLRTDQDGAVQFRLFTRTIQVSTYRERQRFWH